MLGSAVAADEVELCCPFFENNTINSSLFIQNFKYSIRALPGLENSYKHLVGGAVFSILGDYYKIQFDPHNAKICVDFAKC